MHLYAIHGVVKGTAMVVYSWINRIIRPRLKLH
jgi:NADH dehydrogenase